jgi:hypothetical protein
MRKFPVRHCKIQLVCSVPLEIKFWALCHWLYFLLCYIPLPLDFNSDNFKRSVCWSVLTFLPSTWMKPTEFWKKEKTRRTGVAMDKKRNRADSSAPHRDPGHRAASTKENPSRRKCLLSSLHLRRTGQPLVYGHGRCRSGSVEHPLSARVERRPQARAPTGAERPSSGRGRPQGRWWGHRHRGSPSGFLKGEHTQILIFVWFHPLLSQLKLDRIHLMVHH